MKHSMRKNTPLQLYRINIFSYGDDGSLSEESDTWIILSADQDEAMELLKNQYAKFGETVYKHMTLTQKIDLEYPCILLGAVTGGKHGRLGL
jgi:hypothetical protein